MPKFLIVSSHHESFDTMEQAMEHLRSQQNQHMLAGGCLQHGIAEGETVKTLIVAADVVKVVQPALAVAEGAETAFRNTPDTRIAYQLELERRSANQLGEDYAKNDPRAYTYTNTTLASAPMRQSPPLPLVAAE